MNKNHDLQKVISENKDAVERAVQEAVKQAADKLTHKIFVEAVCKRRDSLTVRKVAR